MAFGIGNLNQIVSDFKNALDQIFGNKTSAPGKHGRSDLFDAAYGGTIKPDYSKWRGNNDGYKKVVRYGFSLFSTSDLSNKPVPTGDTDNVTYFLDIPPQSITQKETFATNIQATRKGVIVESEGVVFKDIVIQGTTGIFPGKRGNFNGPQPSPDISKSGPTEDTGVAANSGLSKDSNEKTISGYEEFLNLRQFFLKYAHDKVHSNGDLFLIFINEKDNQQLVVEPLEFTMERSSKSPLTYNYKIVLKAIGSLSNVLNGVVPNASPLSDLEKIGNIAANVSATVGQYRSAINATSTLFQKTFQAIDQTINGPLRQLQFASQDLADGITTTLTLPSILFRNTTSTILNTIENFRTSGQAVATAVSGSSSLAATQSQGFSSKTQASTDAQTQKVLTDSASRGDQSTSTSQGDQIVQAAASDSRVNIPRSFVENAKAQLNSLSDNFADSLNLGDPLYDQVKGRVVTQNPGPLKVASDDELILLGNLKGSADTLNSLLANNSAYESDAEVAFDNARLSFEDPNLPEAEQLVKINKPDTVREVMIQRGQTLERIAAMNLGDALRWTEIAVLNNLKAPYISDDGGDHVKKPGENLLIPSR